MQISLEQLLGLLGAGSPFTLMTVMWWLERKERIRLQGVVEGYLPTARSVVRVSKALRKVVEPDSDDDGEGGS